MAKGEHTGGCLCGAVLTFAGSRDHQFRLTPGDAPAPPRVTRMRR